MNLPKGTGNSGIEKEAMIFSRPNRILSLYPISCFTIYKWASIVRESNRTESVRQR